MQPTDYKVEPFGRGVAFTAVSGLGQSLLRGLRGLRGLGRVGGGGRRGRVLWARRLLTLLDLLHLRPLAVGILLPVCSTADKTRTVRHLRILILQFILVLLYIY